MCTNAWLTATSRHHPITFGFKTARPHELKRLSVRMNLFHHTAEHLGIITSLSEGNRHRWNFSTLTLHSVACYWQVKCCIILCTASQNLKFNFHRRGDPDALIITTSLVIMWLTELKLSVFFNTYCLVDLQKPSLSEMFPAVMWWVCNLSASCCCYMQLLYKWK